MGPVSSAAPEVAPGSTLPERRIPITRTLVVASAIATRDYQDVHHDPELARARGSKDVFMNILTSNGLVESYVRDWAGSACRIRRLRTRLGAPNYPGDEMVLTGVVLSRQEDDCVTVEVTGRNAAGVHVSALVEAEIPTPDTRGGLL